MWATCSRTDILFADDFLKTCSVSLLSTPSSITRLGWGWFRSSIYELSAGFCTNKLSEGVKKVGGKKMRGKG